MKILGKAVGNNKIHRIQIRIVWMMQEREQILSECEKEDKIGTKKILQGRAKMSMIFGPKQLSN